MATVAVNRFGAGAEIVVWGLRDTMKALAAIDPLLKKQTTQRLDAIMGEVVNDARSRYPVVTGAAQRGVVKKRGGSPSALFGYRLQNTDPGGAIIEFANIGHSRQGAMLVDTLTARYGEPGRFLWQAWDDNKTWFSVQFRSILTDAENEIQQAMDRADDRWAS